MLWLTSSSDRWRNKNVLSTVSGFGSGIGIRCSIDLLVVLECSNFLRRRYQSWSCLVQLLLLGFFESFGTLGTCRKARHIEQAVIMILHGEMVDYGRAYPKHSVLIVNHQLYGR